MYKQIDAYVLRLIRESTPERTVWNIEKIRQGKSADWNYIDGCMLTALLSMSEITGDARYFDFAEHFVDSFVAEDGTIRTYHMEKYNLDDVNEGRVLFPLYERTHKEKYKKAAALLREQLSKQPRTAEGSFWHKLIYPNQVWLDGLYMAQPFYALYEKSFGAGDYSDLLRQINTVREKCSTRTSSSITTATTPAARRSGRTRRRGAQRTSGCAASAGLPCRWPT